MRTAAEVEFDQVLGEQIRQARALRHLSQEQLGDLVGVTHQQMQKYERGQSGISVARLVSLAAVLDLPVSYFLNRPAERRRRPGRMTLKH